MLKNLYWTFKYLGHIKFHSVFIQDRKLTRCFALIFFLYSSLSNLSSSWSLSFALSKLIPPASSSSSISLETDFCTCGHCWTNCREEKDEYEAGDKEHQLARTPLALAEWFWNCAHTYFLPYNLYFWNFQTTFIIKVSRWQKS